MCRFNLEGDKIHKEVIANSEKEESVKKKSYRQREQVYTKKLVILKLLSPSLA